MAHETRLKLYQKGLNDAEIAKAETVHRDVIRKWRRRHDLPPNNKQSQNEPPEAKNHDAYESIEATLTAAEVARINSLEDLLKFFKVDTDAWEVRDYRINKWEQASGNTQSGITITPLYQVRANLVPRIERRVEIVRQIIEDLIRDAKNHAPNYKPINRVKQDGEPCLFELAVLDPHVGLMAWGKETGQPQDLPIAVKNYGDAIEYLLGLSKFYNVERVLYIAGNDFLHVDGPAFSNRGGATTMGTAQDVDSRLGKMFSTGRKALVEGIDRARQVAPVDVVFVPGNHDENTTYHLGEVIAAWYRNCPDVNVIFSPNKRQYYAYGKNALMLTHGEEYRRMRDSLPLIFTTEGPRALREAWLDAEHFEIHTGHNHIALEGRFNPTSELNETRGIRTRSLPGLTATDSWHHKEGYRHRRTSTALVFRKSGGVMGTHEFNPQ